MSTKKNDETINEAPIKRLSLRREVVRDLNVRTGLRAGWSQCLATSQASNHSTSQTSCHTTVCSATTV